MVVATPPPPPSIPRLSSLSNTTVVASHHRYRDHHRHLFLPFLNAALWFHRFITRTTILPFSFEEIAYPFEFIIFMSNLSVSLCCWGIICCALYFYSYTCRRKVIKEEEIQWDRVWSFTILRVDVMLRTCCKDLRKFCYELAKKIASIA